MEYYMEISDGSRIFPISEKVSIYHAKFKIQSQDNHRICLMTLNVGFV